MPYCEVCGAEVSSTSRFCRNCGASQRVSPTQTTVNASPPVVQPASTAPPSPPTVQPVVIPSQLAANLPPPPPPLVVQSAPTVLPPPPPPPVAQPIRTVPPPPPPVQSPMYTQVPMPSGERVLGVMVLRKPKSLGRFDSYTGVVTNLRMIFAQMTNEMMTQAVQVARDQAKAGGKGFWGQWGDQLKTAFTYSQRYLSMPPSAILAEMPGNFAFDNNAIREIKLKEDRSRGEDLYVHELKMEIRSFSGNYEYRMDHNENYIKLLKQVYGERVKTPFGLFSSHGINIRLGF